MDCRLYLISPEIADADAFAPALEAACAAGDVAALLLRLAPADERTQINRIKALAPIAQAHDAAVLVAAPAHLAVRGGADGIHLNADIAIIPDARDTLKAERMIGMGGLRTKHDAMEAGEAGVDYVMFGEPDAKGAPSFELTLERAGWWAPIFETPCVAFAQTLDQVAALAATGVEFVALGDAVWTHPAGPAQAVKAALAALEGAAA
jgi:thiamine-phosphate pyrophosphorylase